MARVSFSALIENITGKLAGSVFQDSYGGFQIRTRVSPRNPQSNYQQLRRGEFGFISALWRSLDAVQRQTFIAAATTPPEALNLFISANVNLTLINIPIINSFVPSATPGAFVLTILDLTPLIFLIQATGGTVIVPAGTKMLLFATTDKEPTKIFTNPSQFTPIQSFDEGTDLSVPADIISSWSNRFGLMRVTRNICIKSVLIDKSNGNRGPDSIVCFISTTPILMDTLQDVITNGNVLTQANDILTGGFQLNFIAGTPDFSGQEANIALNQSQIDLFIQNSTGTAFAELNFQATQVNLQVNDGTGNLSFGNVAQWFTIAKGADPQQNIATSVNTTEADNHGNIDLVPLAADFINDAAAAAGGIAVGKMYHTSGVVKLRLS